LKKITMNKSVSWHVKNLLKQHGVSFEVLHQQPGFTSEEAAAVGLDLDHPSLNRHFFTSSAPEAVSATNSA